MNKKFFMILVIVVGIFILPTVSFSQTFNLPSPVRVSGNAGGKIFFESSNPAALDMISGAVQFHNDIMKSRGWGMTNNAFRSAERVSPNLLTIQLYEETLKTQFSFNIKSGALWGLIPSCMLIPDNKTVIVEYSGPSRDSEDGNGGHHFSLIAGISDPSYYKAVGNIMPCPTGMVQSVEVPMQISPAPAPIVQATPAPAPAVTYSVEKKSSPVVKRPARKKECDPCIVAVKADTEAIRKSVGDVDPAEVFEEQTLQNKAKKNLEVSKEVKSSVGDGKANESGKVLSLHDKIGEPTIEGETVMDVLKDVQKKVTPPPTPPEKDFGKWWWLVIAILAAIVVLYLWQQQGRRRPATPAP